MESVQVLLSVTISSVGYGSISFHLPFDENIPGAAKAFQDAIKNANGQAPEKILSDAHKSYAVGINLAFEGKEKPEHVANCGVKKRHANNNRIERLNGTLRERVKVQRGWKSYETPLAEGQRIAYNFVKPHQALAGKTPANAAGILMKEKDKWMELLRDAKTSSIKRG